MDSKLSFQEAFQAWEQGCDIRCGDSRSQSIQFNSGDNMLILFRSDVYSDQWEMKE